MKYLISFPGTLLIMMEHFMGSHHTTFILFGFAFRVFNPKHRRFYIQFEVYLLFYYPTWF